MKEKLAFLKPPLVWAWKNRRAVLGYGFGTILLCKWAFGFVSTDKLIELVQALAGVLNPVTLFN